MTTPRQIQFVRGNTQCVNHYVGPIGSFAINLDDWSIHIQDGVTPGGHVVGFDGYGNANVAAYLITNGYLTSTSANLSTYAWSSNVSAVISSLANYALNANVSNYGNVNVHTYLGSFDGNIVPSANSVFTLGSITNQWKDLFLSNATVYFDGLPLNVNSQGNLFVNGNELASVDYVTVATDTGNIRFSGDTIFDNQGNITIQTANGAFNWVFGDNGVLTVADSIRSVTDLDLFSNYNINLTGSTAYLYAQNPDNANQYSGVDLELGTGVTVEVDNNTGNVKLWRFRADSGLLFPDSTIQYTAFTPGNISYLNISGDLAVYGNIYHAGNVFQISANDLIVNDNIIYFANANPANLLDIGVVGSFTAGGSYQHTGLIRDASDNTWRLFSNVTAEPGLTVDFTDAVYDALVVGNITSPTIALLQNNITDANLGMKGYVDSINNNLSTYAWNANIPAPYGNANVAGFLPTYTGTVTATNVYVSGSVIGNLRTVRSVPTTAQGTDGDIAGDIAIDSNYIYVATGTYQTGNTWTVTFNSTNVSAFDTNTINVPFDQIPSYVLGESWNDGSRRYWTNGTWQTPTGQIVYFLMEGPLIGPPNNTTYLVFTESFTLPSTTVTLIRTEAPAIWETIPLTTFQSNAFGNLSASIISSNLAMKGYVDNAISTIVIPAPYSNVNVAAYLTTNNYLTSATANLSLYAWNGNASGGGTTYSNVNVAAYLATATITTTGNVTTSGNIQGRYVRGDGGFLTNVTVSVVGNVVGTQPNVTIQSSGNVWVFDYNGNLTLPGNVWQVNYANGTPVTFATSGGSNYSNVDVANYLTVNNYLTTATANLSLYAWNANVTAANVGMQGYVDGQVSAANVAWQANALAQQQTIGNIVASSYSNVNLSVYTGNIVATVNGYTIGYRDIPQVLFSANATLQPSDAGKHYYSTSSSTLYLTVANNATQSFNIGAAINIINQGTANIVIAPGSGVTLYLAGNTIAGTRTLSSYGMATINKVATDTWWLVGVGLS